MEQAPLKLKKIDLAMPQLRDVSATMLVIFRGRSLLLFDPFSHAQQLCKCCENDACCPCLGYFASENGLSLGVGGPG